MKYFTSLLLCFFMMVAVNTQLSGQLDCGSIIIDPPQQINQSDTFQVDISYVSERIDLIDSIDVTIDFGDDVQIRSLNAASLQAPTLPTLFVFQDGGNGAQIKGKVNSSNNFTSGTFCRIRFVKENTACLDIRLATDDFPAPGESRKITFENNTDCPVSLIGSNNRVLCTDSLTVSGQVLFAVGDQSLSTDIRELILSNFNHTGFALSNNNNYQIEIPPFAGGFSTDVLVNEDYEFNNQLGVRLCGINVSDIISTRSFILGIESFENKWQYFAADANSNGQIRISDIVTMIRVILGINVEGPTPETTTMPYAWAYPSQQDLDAVSLGDANIQLDGHTIPVISSDQDSINFFAIKRGDVTGDCARYQNLQPDNPMFSAQGSQDFTIYDQSLIKGQTVEVDVDVAALTENKIVTLALGFDTDNIDIELIKSGRQKVTDSTFTIDHTSGQLNFIWVPDTIDQFPAENFAYKLKITAKKSLPTLAGSVWFNADVVENRVYDLSPSDKIAVNSKQYNKPDGASYELFLNFVEDKSKSALINSYENKLLAEREFVVKPINPSKNQIRFMVSSIEPKLARIEIYNMAGQMLVEQIIDLPSGKSTIELSKTQNLKIGSYLWRIVINDDTINAGGIIVKQ